MVLHRRPVHSNATLAALITARLSMISRRCWPSSSGVCAGTAADSSHFGLHVIRLVIFTTLALSFPIISLGVPQGANVANPSGTSAFSIPASLRVGQRRRAD